MFSPVSDWIDRLLPALLRASGLALLMGCVHREAGVPLHQIGWDVFTLGPVSSPIQPNIPIDASATNDAKFAAFIDYLRSGLATAHVPGAAVAVILDGKVAYTAGIGVARADGAAAITEDTQFRIGSVSKLFTAVTTMILVEKGRLDLTSPITDIAPWFTRRAGSDAAAVTLDLALSHRAGIPDQNLFACSTSADWRLSEYFKQEHDAPLWAAPGAVYDYSNGGYALLGGVIEQVTGMPFAEAVRQLVFEPAGLPHMTYDPSTVEAEALAWGHDSAGSALANQTYDCGVMRPAGGVIANVNEVAHVLELLLAGGGSLLLPQSVAALELDRVPTQEQPGREYCYGLYSTKRAGTRVLVHPGDVPGYSSFIAIVPDHSFGIVVLANGAGNVPNSALAAVDLFLGLPPTTTPDRYATSNLPDYVGTYSDPVGMLGRFEVSLDGEQLMFRALGDQPQPLPGNLSGVFWRENNGTVSYFVTRSGVARRQ